MPRGAKNLESAWKLISWFTDAKPQAQYANELVAVMGPAAKYNTANMEALAELPWTASEYKALEAQMQHLAAVPEYPGGYIIARYVDFAFMDAYNDNADPVEAMLDNITEINKEISRKRKEFGLEYYEISYSTSFVEDADGEIVDPSLADSDANAE
jgi:maltose-binding protein MalE